MGWECGRAESRDGASTASEVDWGDVSEDLAFAGDWKGDCRARVGEEQGRHSRQRDQRCSGCLREGRLTGLRSSPEGTRPRLVEGLVHHDLAVGVHQRGRPFSGYGKDLRVVSAEAGSPLRLGGRFDTCPSGLSEDSSEGNGQDEEWLHCRTMQDTASIQMKMLTETRVKWAVQQGKNRHLLSNCHVWLKV